jgi:uncharacterized surface protein with fasciclin (FAS1) repeats
MKIAFLLTFFFGSMALTTTAHDDEDRSSLPRDLQFGTGQFGTGLRPPRCPRGRNIVYESRNPDSTECIAPLTFDCDGERFFAAGCGCGCSIGAPVTAPTVTAPTVTAPTVTEPTGTEPTGTVQRQRCNFFGPESCPAGLTCRDTRGICENVTRARCPGLCRPIRSLAERICSESDLSTLCTLLGVAGIDLSGPPALTVVGPTDAAFALLDPAVVALLLSPEGLVTLQTILTYHVFSGTLTTDILVDGPLATLQGGNVIVNTTAPLAFNQAKALVVDIRANNGVLYKIDQVLNPDSPGGF